MERPWLIPVPRGLTWAVRRGWGSVGNLGQYGSLVKMVTALWWSLFTFPSRALLIHILKTARWFYTCRQRWSLFLFDKSEGWGFSLLSASRAGFWVKNYDSLGWAWFTGHHCPSLQRVYCEMFTKALLGRVQCLFLSWWECGWMYMSGGRVPWQREKGIYTCCVPTRAQDWVPYLHHLRFLRDKAAATDFLGRCNVL